MKQVIFVIMLMFFSISGLAQSYTVKYTPASHNPALMSLSMSIGSYHMDNAVIDSGCTSSQLTYNDYVCLKNAGLLSEDNFIGYVKTRDCHGSIQKKPKYRLPSVSIGKMIIHDIDIIFDTVNKDNTFRLLGLNFMNCFTSVNVNFRSQTITFSV